MVEVAFLHFEEAEEVVEVLVPVVPLSYFAAIAVAVCSEQKY